MTGGAGRADELMQIAQRTRDAQRLLVQAGVAPEAASLRAEDYGNLLRQAREANLLRDDYARLTERARTAEDALAVAQQASGPGLVEGERQVLALRSEQIRQLDTIIARTAELARLRPEDSTLADDLERLRVERAKLAQFADPTKLRLDAGAENIGDTIADGLERAAFEGGKLRDILRDIGTTVLRQVTQELVTKPAAVAIGNIVKGAGGQGTGENLIGQFGQLVGLLPPGQGTGGAASSGPISVGSLLGSITGIVPGDVFGGDQGAGQAGDATAQATASIAGLASAAGGSAEVLGALPAAAAIPATTALGSLAVAAQAAAAALAQIGGSTVVGQGGDLLDLFGGFFGGGSGYTPSFSGDDLGRYFDAGGYTGDAGVAEAAGVVHGQEFVFSAPAVRRLGVGVLEQLHQAARHGQDARSALLPGYAGGGYVGRHSGSQALPAPPGPGEQAVVLQAGEVLVAPAAISAGLAPTSPQAASVSAAESRARQAGAGLRAGLQVGIAIVPRPSHAAPGLAPDEMPAVLPLGTEVLTADDARIPQLLGGRTDVLAARNAAAAAAALGFHFADDGRTAHHAAMPAHAPTPDMYAGLERFHTGGIVGGGMAGPAAAWAGAAAHYAPPAAGADAPAQGMPTIVQHLNFSGPVDRRTVQQAASDGARMALAARARGNA